MDTYFTQAERVNEKELIAEIEIVNRNPVMSALLHSIGGLLAILDEHRQIVALNDSFLRMLDINNPEESLGLRPGEALQCIYAYEEPAGCGTTKFCSTCGAAIAIVSSLCQDRPVERICALRAKKRDLTIDIALLVRSHAIKIDGRRFLLLFLQDITFQQQRAALERTFFHDVNNMLSALVGASEMLYLENSQSNLVKIIRKSSLRLKNEVEIQRSLSERESFTYHPLRHKITTDQIQEEIKSFFFNHPSARNKNLQFSPFCTILSIKTDISLLLRIVCNMITNALESTEKNGTVKVWLEQNDNSLSFCVWNAQQIPQDIARRIFQRNFSTKEGAGRGVGTYSMKLFGEQILGGQVDFTTSQEEGTIFRFSLPL
ncbi:MAG: sensor histidine kinase [Thermodesulfobacteriota bacterium]|nr:sensor histidine kinase [Thermodesulfobacteriota bacterium]